MDRQSGHLTRQARQRVRWGLLAGAASLLALGVEASPAAADELNDWSYDAQTRSLTLTVPSNVTPSISVLAPDQLLIELPNTQVGDVAGLTVGDGIVDGIALEQPAPDMLWVVMEFAEGTILANGQSAVPVETADIAGAQRWEVRPLVAASSRTAPVPTASSAADPIDSAASGNAESLRTPAVDIAQADFPDLPILEPGISLIEPVSVPPIDATAPVPPPAPPAIPPAPPPAPVVSVPDLPEVEPEVVPEVESEVSAPAETATPVEVVSDDTALSDEPTASADIPEEPPFLGEFEVPVIDETSPLEEAPAATVPDEPEPVFAADEDNLEEVATEDLPVEIPVEAVAVDESAGEQIEADEASNETSIESVATAPRFEPEDNADFVVEPATEKPQEIDFSAQGVTPQNTERWPEPVPFGAPLP